MNLVGDPAAINAMASLLDAKAEQVTAGGRRVQAQANHSNWQCPKADRFRATVAREQQQTEQIASEMHELAQQLRRVAIQVQDELNALYSLEMRVRALFDGWIQRPGIEPPWIGTPWRLGNLPEPGDPAWTEIAASLGV
jgi:uncharacterized protein YukE